jgi:zinc/manganese transport system substrate-binding protein
MRQPRTAVLLSAVLLAAAAAARAELKIVTSTQDLSSIAAAIGGDRVETFALAKGYQDPHVVDAKPSFVLKLSRADLLIVAGLDLEVGYLPPLIDQSRNAGIRPGSNGHLDASIGCEVLQQPAVAVTRAMGDVHPWGNPHYWTDPANGRVMARAIAARLSVLDPGGAATYAANLASFEQRLSAKERDWRAMMAPWAGTEVVSFHNSWPNFARRFGLEVIGHIEPKPGIPPTPSHTLEIINRIRDRQVRLILVEPYVDTKTPEFVAAKSGAEVVQLYPSVGGRPEIDDYFALFDYDLRVIVQALESRR